MVDENWGIFLKILILGGTRFLGRTIAEASISSGHNVTFFNRGKTNPGLFPNCETLIGDRDGDMTSISGRSWDIVYRYLWLYPEDR